MIHVLSLAYNCSNYVQHLYHNLKEKAEGNFCFHLVEHSDDTDEKSKNRNFANGSENFYIHDRKQDNPSWSVNHGAGLDFGIRQIQDPNEKVMIIDIDCYMFLKRWDIVLFDALENYDVVTTVRPFCQNPKHIGQPMAYLTLIRPETILKNGLDFLPLYKEDLLSGKVDKVEKGFFDVGHKLEKLSRIKKIKIRQPSEILLPLKHVLTKYKGSQDYYLDGNLVATHIRDGGRGTHTGVSESIMEHLKRVDHARHPN